MLELAVVAAYPEAEVDTVSTDSPSSCVFELNAEEIELDASADDG